jgi:hypothetical protein
MNKYGVGLISWKAASEVGRPAEARKLSQAYLLTAQSLDKSSVTVPGAMEYVRQVRVGLPGDWSKWESVVEDALNKASRQHGIGSLWFRNYFYEIGKSLEAVK